MIFQLRGETITAVGEVFDRVFVVSLIDSPRRNYVAKHLADHSFGPFSWHDATPAHSDRVREARAAGLVHPVLPCFRCGLNTCGSESCNNILTDPQVATFITYLDLLKKVAGSDEFVLSMEDDIRLLPTWRKRVGDLENWMTASHHNLDNHQPFLVRLGWAKSEDHVRNHSTVFIDDLRMANPCFGFNSAFARKALAQFSAFDTTADIFLHDQSAGGAVTMLPPLAYELSWSTGEVPSTILPKQKHVDFLVSEMREEEAQAERTRVAASKHHSHHRKYLITGHPRCGTGYAAALFRQLDIDIGHEKTGARGISSWMHAAGEGPFPFGADEIARGEVPFNSEVLIQIVRNPLKAIPSIMLDNLWSAQSYSFRRLTILNETGVDLDSFEENFERALNSLTLWNTLIRRRGPTFFVRLEDAHRTLPKLLRRLKIEKVSWAAKLDSAPVNADKMFQGIRHIKPLITDQHFQKLCNASRNRLASYCLDFGYPMPPKLLSK